VTAVATAAVKTSNESIEQREEKKVRYIPLLAERLDPACLAL
jgi:hypothetical protein